MRRAVAPAARSFFAAAGTSTSHNVTKRIVASSSSSSSASVVAASTRHFATPQPGQPRKHKSTGTIPVMLPSELDVKRLQFRDAIQNSHGGQHVFVGYQSPGNTESTIPVRLQTPWVKLPFGLSQYSPESPWQILINLAPGSTQEEQKEMSEFADCLERFDARVVEEGVQMAKSWWPGKTMIPEIVGYNYRSPVKPAVDESAFPPTMKIRVGRDEEGEPKVDCFKGEDQTKLPPKAALVRGVRAKALLQCTGLWFVQGNWGSSWRALQIMIDPEHQDDEPRQTLDGPAFRQV